MGTNDVEAFGFFLLDEDTFFMVPDEKARFVVVDQEGETVIFVIDAFVTDDFETWLETAQAVMDSITWDE